MDLICLEDFGSGRRHGYKVGQFYDGEAKR